MIMWGETSADDKFIATSSWTQTVRRWSPDDRIHETQADLSDDPTKKYYLALGLLGYASSALCLYFIARSHAQLNQLPQAISFAQTASVEAAESGDKALLCRTLRITARYLMLLARHEEALPILTRTVACGHGLGFAIGIAQSLELLGYNCAARRDLPGTRMVYKGAHKQFAKIETTRMGGQGLARVLDNGEKLSTLTESDEDGFAALARPYPWYQET
ncbi:hypothetical protein R3P38DRAFT_3188836 [Favolaschia claudopus]|uniref:Uncharacterized protein n=1 Tax=Favolaschia claudopus TaxID=2862362 RepID=A0AAW0BSV5_9AGAR